MTSSPADEEWIRAEVEWAHAEAVRVLGPGQVAMGLQFSRATGGWVVWLSLYGTDVSGLSGWPTSDEAKVAFERYRALQWDTDLLPAVELDEAAERYRKPEPFTRHELERIQAAMRALDAGRAR